MTINDAVAFWSYARLDDERALGRIVRLAKLVQMEFGLITGAEMEIFVDRNDLKWGEMWRERIDEALQSTTFFIPIITPTYFQRDECRRELWSFNSAAQSLGVGDLIMPIVYQRVPDFSEENPNEAISLVARMHSEFFDQVRLEDEGSSTHRQAVNKLAQRLAELTEQISQRPAAVASPSVTAAVSASTTDVAIDFEPDEEGSPGLLDHLVSFEPEMAEWLETINAFPAIMHEISAVVDAGTEKMKGPGEVSFAKRILIAREVAEGLDDPVARLEAIGDRYSGHVQRVDPAVRALIELARLGSNGDQAAQAESAVQSIRGMAAVSRESVGRMRDFVSTAKRTASLSRDLRPVIGRMNTAMMNVVDAQSIIDEWDDMAGEV